jgi:alanyl-tRNA synthetase
VTDRLYYTDSYLVDFEASVVDQTDGGRRVYLDRTAFYPTSGGQQFDTGELGGIGVTDVVDEGDRIAHCLAAPLADSLVRGRVHWPRRFDHMQQHTGQHLLSAVLADLLGLSTIAVHFGKLSSTVDLEGGALTQEQLARVEDQVNEAVVENRPVRVSFEDAREALGLRKPSTRNGTLRIISIEGLDRSACGGTHVRSTGEIGAILLRKAERVKRGVRVEFVCGGRAVRAARADHQLLAGLAAEFSAAPIELPGVLAAQRDQLKVLGTARRELEEELQGYRARQLYAAAGSDRSEIRRAIVREGTGSLTELRGLAQAYAGLPGAIFIGAIEAPPSILLAAAPDSGVHAGAVLKGLLEANGGRGGGSATIAQGSLPSLAHLERVLLLLSGARAEENDQGIGAAAPIP